MKTAFFVLCVSMFALSARGSLISTFTKNPSNGHFYALVDCQSSWATAESEAQIYGGHLATVRNESEQNWLYSTFGMFGEKSRPFFIGLSDQATEGTFVWSSGEPVTTFTNWGIGEPNNAREGEDYVYVDAPSSESAGKWNDIPSPFSDFAIDGVIEVEINILATAVNPANGHTYYLIDTPDKSWATAEAQAQVLGGHLVSINDAVEQTWVYSLFSNFGGVSRYLWIGLTDQDSTGTFTWTNGDPVAYKNWFPGEPNGQHFVHMWSPESGTDGGKWNDNDVTVPGYDFLGVVEVPTSVTPTPTPVPTATPKPSPTPSINTHLINKYMRQYFVLTKKLNAAKHIHDLDRRKKAVRKIQKQIRRIKQLIKAATA